MDKAALGLAMEQNMPVIVFELAKDGNILRAANGESIGTKVSQQNSCSFAAQPRPTHILINILVALVRYDPPLLFLSGLS